MQPGFAFHEVLEQHLWQLIQSAYMHILHHLVPNVNRISANRVLIISVTQADCSEDVRNEEKGWGVANWLYVTRSKTVQLVEYMRSLVAIRLSWGTDRNR